MNPASDHRDAAILRIDEASEAMRRLAATPLSAESEGVRSQWASQIAEVLRALTLAKTDLLRSLTVDRAAEARAQIRAYIESLTLAENEKVPYFALIVVPLPIDHDRIDMDANSDKLGIQINRLAIEIQMKGRKKHDWLITAPSSSYTRSAVSGVEFIVDAGAGTRYSELRIFDTGCVVFTRPLYSWFEQPGFNLGDLERDVIATLIFARNFFAEEKASPVQVAVQLVLVNASHFLLAIPERHGTTLWKAGSGEPRILFPMNAAVGSYAEFVQDSKLSSRRVIEALRNHYCPADS